ncbi:hypothetical protein ABPG75_004897 [Micractinium tetrahymenae]
MATTASLSASTAVPEPFGSIENGVDAAGTPKQAAGEASGFAGEPGTLPAHPAGPSDYRLQVVSNGTARSAPQEASTSAAGGGGDALAHSTAAAWAGAYAAAAEADSPGRGHGQPAAAAAHNKQQQQQQQQQHQLLRRLSSSSRMPPLSLAVLRSLSARRRPEVWGCLRPAAGTKLPFVLLQGKGVALGRGRDAYHERLPQLLLSRASSFSLSPHSFPSVGSSSGHGSVPPDAASLPSATSANMSSPFTAAARAAGSSGHASVPPDAASLPSATSANMSSPFTAAARAAGSSGGTAAAGSSGASSSVAVGAPGGGGGAAASPFAAGAGEVDKDSAFVEIPDGRVSRLHAWVKWDGARQQAVLEVLSSSGTLLDPNRKRAQLN